MGDAITDVTPPQANHGNQAKCRCSHIEICSKKCLCPCVKGSLELSDVCENLNGSTVFRKVLQYYISSQLVYSSLSYFRVEITCLKIGCFEISHGFIKGEDYLDLISAIIFVPKPRAKRSC
jgi:hypothetical protein